MRLYLGNLPYKATEADLSAWFEQQGCAVDSVMIMRDRFSNEPRGFGFAEVKNNKDAERVIEHCNGKLINGRALVINEARPLGKSDAERPETSGSGGGG